MDTTGSHPHGRKIKSGRKWVLMNARKRKVLVRTAHAKVGVSLCVLARRYGINKFFVEKMIKEEGLAYQKRCMAPLVAFNHAETQKRGIRRLARGTMRAKENLDVAMDDDTYFTFTGSEMSANSGY